MSHALLVSDNEILNLLYEVNLKVYVDTNITIKRSPLEASKLMEHFPDIDIILYFAPSKLTDEDKDFLELVQNFSKKIPVLFLGNEVPHYKGEKNTVSEYFNLRSVIRSVAKTLEVTAKDMVMKSVPKFYPIPLKLVKGLDSTECDIFVKRKNEKGSFEYFLLIKKDSPLNQLKNAKEENFEYLYVDSSERLRFINKLSVSFSDALKDEALTEVEKLDLVSQGMGIVAEEIFEQEEISEEVAKISAACIEAIQDVITFTPALKNLLKHLAESKTGYVYLHSVLATFISSGIIKNMSWGNQEQKNKVAFALFFHDIFLIPVFNKYPDIISEEELLFQKDITEKEKNIILEHANLASNIIKNYPHCPIGADMIIRQHHGMTSGIGFAQNFKDDISPLSKVMIISEHITTHILKNVKDKKKEILNKEEVVLELKAKYRNHTYQKIADAFLKINI